MTLHTLFALHAHFFFFCPFDAPIGSLQVYDFLKFCILIVYENLETSMKTIDK